VYIVTHYQISTIIENSCYMATLMPHFPRLRNDLLCVKQNVKRTWLLTHCDIVHADMTPY